MSADKSFTDNTQGRYPNAPPAYSEQQQNFAGYAPPPTGQVHYVPSATTIQPGVTVIQPTYGGGSTIITEGGATVLLPLVMRRHPVRMKCGACHAEIVTRVLTEPVMRTHLMAALLCLFGFWPCVCIPYCVDSCMTARHYCPNCQVLLGSSE